MSEEIILKSGLEIHQQLDTSKLFCHCPSLLRKDEPDYVVERKLHAVAGEGGVVDVAVVHEAGLDKKFVYQAYNDNTCLVELDEQPPFPINEEATCQVVEPASIIKVSPPLTNDAAMEPIFCFARICTSSHCLAIILSSLCFFCFRSRVRK